ISGSLYAKGPDIYFTVLYNVQFLTYLDTIKHKKMSTWTTVSVVALELPIVIFTEIQSPA
ncbi:hypothetical protein ACUODF_53805, partial [Escherichia coli]